MSDYRVPSVSAAIRILHELDLHGDGGATQSELVRSTGVSKSTMHNLLATLEAASFVRRDPRSRSYSLGPALIPLGASASRQTKIVETAVEAVAPLPAEYGLSFAVAQCTPDDHAQVIERFYPPQDVHVGITIGSRFGPLDGALGKVILAAMDHDRVEELIAGAELPAHTNSTITRPRDLLAEVAEVRRRGWAASEQELNENNAVAVPILGSGGEVELILLALGFATQLEGERLAETGELLVRTAAEIMSASGSPAPAERSPDAGSP